jgi:hypothetical protein
MAEIKFYANTSASVPNTDWSNYPGTEIPVGSSGIGFYGSQFGVAVPVGGQQSKTYITDTVAGTIQGQELSNTAMYSVGGDVISGTVQDGSVLLNGSTVEMSLANLPNYQCPLNVRFVHDSAVSVQNCKLRIFNGTSLDVSANGVTTYVFEARHPRNDQTNGYSLSHRAEDAGDNFVWTPFYGYDPTNEEDVDDSAGLYMNLTDSPGAFGRNESRSAHTTAEDKTAYNISYNDGSLHESTRHDWYLALSSEPESIGSKLDYALYFTCEYL